MALLAGAACMRCASVFFASNSLWGGEGALAPRPKENSKQKRQTRTAPHCDRGNLRMANQVATGAGKAFAYGTGAGGRSHLAKLRDGARHCNSAQIFTRRYEMVRDTVTDKAPRAFKEQAPGSRRTERASPLKADHGEQANQTTSQGTCAWCARCVFFCARRGSLTKILWGHPSSLVVLHYKVRAAVKHGPLR